MYQNDLNRAIASITGESVATIKQLGFYLEEPTDQQSNECELSGPPVIDWDELERERQTENWLRSHHVPICI